MSHATGNEEAKHKELLNAARLSKKEARVLLNLVPKMTCWKRHKDVEKATMLDILHACSTNRRFNRMLGLDAALIEKNDDDDEDSEEDLLDFDDEKEEEKVMEDEEEDHAPSEQEVTLKSKGRKRNTVDLGREILKAKPIVRSRFLEFDLFSA